MTTRYGSGPQQGNGYCGYVVGQHLACIRAANPDATRRILARGGTANLPAIGKVYTIREIYVSPRNGKICVRLKELVNAKLPSRSGPWEPGFPVKLFRPLQKLTPEMFMSADAPVKQGEPA